MSCSKPFRYLLAKWSLSYLFLEAISNWQAVLLILGYLLPWVGITGIAIELGVFHDLIIQGTTGRSFFLLNCQLLPFSSDFGIRL